MIKELTDTSLAYHHDQPCAKKQKRISSDIKTFPENHYWYVTHLFS